jgi:tRNA pseudouridine38-40 synthase
VSTTVAITLSYRGTAYAGWQRQANAPTVQQAVEEALARLCGESVRVVGAGRTDAGVHARGQVASCALARALPERSLVHGLDHHLPADVRALAAAVMPPGFDARRCAAAKEYRYRLVRAEVLSPLDAPAAVRAPRGLELAPLRDATARLVGRHDFAAFALAGGSHASSVRTVHLAEWIELGPRLVLRVVGDGFLRGMVRSLVGTLLEVGVGRRTPEAFARLLGGGARCDAGPTAPPEGLVLERVAYPAPWAAAGAGEVDLAAPVDPATLW